MSTWNRCLNADWLRARPERQACRINQLEPARFPFTPGEIQDFLNPME
jgi:hypothetical protein